MMKRRYIVPTVTTEPMEVEHHIMEVSLQTKEDYADPGIEMEVREDVWAGEWEEKWKEEW